MNSLIMKKIKKKSQTNHPLKKFFFFVILFIGIFLIGYGKFLNIYEGVPFDKNNKELVKLDSLTFEIPPLNENISAFSYLVGELNNQKILIKKNEDFHLFPASITKLMTAIVAIDNLSLDEEVTINDYMVSAEGEEGGLVSGEKIKVQDLLKILLITSSNDAAVALEETLNKKGFVFLNLIEEKLKKLKMNDTVFFDSTGLDRKGNFTTAKDLFLLAQEIYKNYPLIGEITREKETEVFSVDKKIRHFLKNTNNLVFEIDNLWLGKTGSTPEAKDCLITIFEFTSPFKNDKIPIVIIVLNSNDRFKDTLKLYQFVENILNQTPIKET